MTLIEPESVIIADIVRFNETHTAEGDLVPEKVVVVPSMLCDIQPLRRRGTSYIREWFESGEETGSDYLVFPEEKWNRFQSEDRVRIGDRIMPHEGSLELEIMFIRDFADHEEYECRRIHSA